MSQKADLLRAFLEERGVRIPHRLGWTKVSCFGPAHKYGDRRPSASVNLTTGRYRCFGCDLNGDVYDLLMVEQGLSYRQAQTILGIDPATPRAEEDTWL